MEAALATVGSLLLVALAFVTGRIAERRHYRSIQLREQRYASRPALTSRETDPDRAVARAVLAQGAVVVSIDHFKRFLSAFRVIFGGELRSYSPLLDRGRREAILRMKESAPHAHAYINLRLETSSIGGTQSKQTTCVEVLAYATAITYAPAGAAAAEPADAG